MQVTVHNYFNVYISIILIDAQPGESPDGSMRCPSNAHHERCGSACPPDCRNRNPRCSGRVRINKWLATIEYSADSIKKKIFDCSATKLLHQLMKGSINLMKTFISALQSWMLLRSRMDTTKSGRSMHTARPVSSLKKLSSRYFNGDRLSRQM